MKRRLQTILAAGILIASCAAATAQPRDAGTSGDSPPGGAWERWDGFGVGPGTMGGFGTGPGAMGGYGMGPGGTGGYGMGPGLGGFLLGRGAGLDLTDDQRQRIKQITDAERKQHWGLMGKMMDEQNKLRDLLEQPTPDPKAVGAAYGSIAQLHQQMLESHLQARNEVHGVLTPEQREQVEQWRGQGGRRDGSGRGGSYRRGMRP